MICGLNKTTLLDYPEHVAATIFTGGCNFRGPFCHNKDLVLNPAHASQFTYEEILSFLKKRQNVLSGVCITGGEPTLQAELVSWIQDIKSLGLSVKLDTNGYRPDVLSHLYEHKLLDYVAMDIKNAPSLYAQTVGLHDFDLQPIEDSIALIKNQSVDYEFRTTIVRELHTCDSIVAMARWIAPCNHYFLQSYRADENVINPVYSSYEPDDFAYFRELIQPIIPNITIRGVD